MNGRKGPQTRGRGEINGDHGKSPKVYKWLGFVERGESTITLQDTEYRK